MSQRVQQEGGAWAVLVDRDGHGRYQVGGLATVDEAVAAHDALAAAAAAEAGRPVREGEIITSPELEAAWMGLSHQHCTFPELAALLVGPAAADGAPPVPMRQRAGQAASPQAAIALWDLAFFASAVAQLRSAERLRLGAQAEQLGQQEAAPGGSSAGGWEVQAGGEGKAPPQVAQGGWTYAGRGGFARLLTSPSDLSSIFVPADVLGLLLGLPQPLPAEVRFSALDLQGSARAFAAAVRQEELGTYTWQEGFDAWCQASGMRVGDIACAHALTDGQPTKLGMSCLRQQPPQPQLRARAPQTTEQRQQAPALPRAGSAGASELELETASSLPSAALPALPTPPAGPSAPPARTQAAGDPGWRSRWTKQADGSYLKMWAGSSTGEAKSRSLYIKGQALRELLGVGSDWSSKFFGGGGGSDDGGSGRHYRSSVKLYQGEDYVRWGPGFSEWADDAGLSHRDTIRLAPRTQGELTVSRELEGGAGPPRCGKRKAVADPAPGQPPPARPAESSAGARTRAATEREQQEQSMELLSLAGVTAAPTSAFDAAADAVAAELAATPALAQRGAGAQGAPAPAPAPGQEHLMAAYRTFTIIHLAARAASQGDGEGRAALPPGQAVTAALELIAQLQVLPAATAGGGGRG